MSAEAVRVVEELQQVLTTQDVVAGLEDEDADHRIRRTFMEFAEPGFEVAMVGPEYASARLDYTGSTDLGKPGRTGPAPSRVTGSRSTT